MTASDDLKQWLDPFTEAELPGLIAARQIVLRRKEEHDWLSSRLNWGILQDLLGAGSIPISNLVVTCRAAGVPHQFYAPDGKLDPARLATLTSKGASLVFYPFLWPNSWLHAALRELRTRMFANAYAGAIASTGDAGALPLHYDGMDMIVFHLEGAKRWIVYDCPEENPSSKGSGKDDAMAPQAKPVLDRVFEPGDVLFLPRGHWHRCENRHDRSVHLNLMLSRATR